MFRRMADVVWVVAAAVVALSLSLSGVHGPVVQPVVALSLVCLLPGYAVTMALFPRSGLGRVERLGLALGLSLAIAALSALVLDRMPWGLSGGAWAILLSSVTLAACLVAILRRRGATAVLTHWKRPLPSAHQVFLFGMAGLLVAGSIVLARRGTLQQETPAFTQLWMLPGERAGLEMVRVGVYSMEASPEQYRLQVQVAGKTVYERPVIPLRPGETWEESIPLSAEQIGSGTVQAQLYLGNSAQVYRQVWLRAGSWNKSAALEGLGPGE